MCKFEHVKFLEVEFAHFLNKNEIFKNMFIGNIHISQGDEVEIMCNMHKNNFAILFKKENRL